MVKIILLYDTECHNCGVKAKFACSLCEKPLCGRCISREKKDLMNNILIPAGLCKECISDRVDDFNQGNFNPLSEAVTIYVTEPSHMKRIKISEKD